MTWVMLRAIFWTFEPLIPFLQWLSSRLVEIPRIDQLNNPYNTRGRKKSPDINQPSRVSFGTTHLDPPMAADRTKLRRGLRGVAVCGKNQLLRPAANQ